MKILAAILVCLCLVALADDLGNPSSLARITKASASSPPSFPSGAIHYWAFEGNLTDAIGSHNLIDEGVNSFPSGKNNTCVEMASAGFINTDSEVYDFSTAYTVSMWVNYASGDTALFKVSGVDAVSVSSGNLTATLGVVADTLNAGAISHSSWHLVVFAYDGAGGQKLSLDGGTWVTGNVVTPLSSIGTYGFYAANSGTKFDEASFWNRVLTQNEVSDLYNSGTGTFGP